MTRYSRHIILSEIGQNGQDKINKAKVLVVGAGGLGCPALQYLVAAGVGTIGIMDFDIVEESNLQRQVLYGTSSLGRNKAIAAKKRLEDLNPTISIHAYPFRLTSTNALSLFNAYDIILDGTDNFESRYLINDASIFTNRPVIYGAIYKFEGQVSVFNFKNGPSYRCLFSEPPKTNTIPNCSEIGVLGVLPGIIGTMQANEAIKIILGLEKVLSGKLFCYNALTSETSTISFSKVEMEIEKVLARKEKFETNEHGFNCEDQIQEILAEKALQNENALFIDIRELDETPKLELSQVVQIPLSQLEHCLDQLDKSKDIVLICRSGIRSKKAVSLLKKHNITNCFSLKDGVLGLMAYK